MSLLATLLASVRLRYSTDLTKAGVVLSDLGGSTYASVCRYPNGPASKTVVVSAKGYGLDEALRALALAWVSETRNTDLLRQALDLSPRVFDRVLKRALA